MSDYLSHYGVKGMKWGIRRYQNKDGTLTSEGKKHYGYSRNIVRNRPYTDDVNDIVKAVGNTTWHYEDTGYDDWFYFDPIDNVYGQTSSKGNGNLSAYRWIFGNLMDCYQYGCEQSQSNSVWESRGYWTKSPVYRNTDNLNRTWLVLRNGYLERYSITDSSSIGVRPVVTVLKSGLNTNNS